MEQDVDNIINELIEFRKIHKEKVEPGGVQLRPEDEGQLLESESFKKVIIATSILNLLTEDASGGYWPILNQLLDNVKRDVPDLVNLYEVTFTKNPAGQYHPLVKMKSN